MSKAFTYILECADGTLYVGWTTNLEGRLRAHNAGRGGRYTRGRRPVRLAYFEEHSTRREAQRREVVLRRMPRATKLRLVAHNACCKEGANDNDYKGRVTRTDS